MDRADGRTAGQIRCLPLPAPPPVPAATPAAATLLPLRCLSVGLVPPPQSLTHHPAQPLLPSPRRTLKCERGLLTRADGSAQWTVGGTSCLASVTGPTQSMASSKEDAERATVDVIFKPRTGMAGAQQGRAVQCKRLVVGCVLCVEGCGSLVSLHLPNATYAACGVLTLTSPRPYRHAGEAV